MKKLLGLFKKKTPKVGRKLAKIGIGLGAATVGLEFARPELIEYLPEKHRIWYIVIELIIGTLGAIFFGAGAASTEDNPDESLNT